MYTLRHRRVLSLSSSVLNQTLSQSKSISSTLSPCSILNLQNHASKLNHFDLPYQSRLFRSSTISLSSRSRSFDRNPADDEIGPDTILFEGCDYEHWLIVMDFPKDTQLTREEMIETYVKTATQVFGSVEEAKKNIYALSTTTYRGFQVLCSEDTSKKFEGLPGVVFVLPDSYIDPVNKEYGGDKYNNGEIIERPPPPQFQRQSRGGDRPRRGPQYQQGNYGPPQNPRPQQNYGAPQGPPPQQNYGAPQGPPPQQNYGAPQGPPPPQNYGAPQGPPPQQNYGAPQGPPPQQNFRAPQGSPPQQIYGAPQGSPPQQNYGPPKYPSPQQNYGQQHYPPPPQQNYGPPQSSPSQQNYGRPPNPLPQQSYGTPPNVPSQRNYGPQQSFSHQQNYGSQEAGDHRGPTPLGSSPAGWGSSQGGRQDARPPYQANFNQRDYNPERDQGGYAPLQGANQNNPRHGDHQLEQRDNMQGGEERTYAAKGTMGTDQGRY